MRFSDDQALACSSSSYRTSCPVFLKSIYHHAFLSEACFASQDHRQRHLQAESNVRCPLVGASGLSGSRIYSAHQQYFCSGYHRARLVHERRRPTSDHKASQPSRLETVLSSRVLPRIVDPSDWYHDQHFHICTCRPP